MTRDQSTLIVCAAASLIVGFFAGHLFHFPSFVSSQDKDKLVRTETELGALHHALQYGSETEFTAKAQAFVGRVNTNFADVFFVGEPVAVADLVKQVFTTLREYLELKATGRDNDPPVRDFERHVLSSELSLAIRRIDLYIHHGKS